MALSTALPKLEADVEALLLELSTSEDPAAARRAYAKKLAAAFYQFVLQAQVVTTGTATNHTGNLL